MKKHFNYSAMIVLLVIVASCATTTPKGMKTLTNKKGEVFTFHGDGTASVMGPFGENLGTHRTNKDNPEEFDNVQLVREGSNSAVYIGSLGLLGGAKIWSVLTGSKNLNGHTFDYRVKKVETYKCSDHNAVHAELNAKIYIDSCWISNKSRTGTIKVHIDLYKYSGNVKKCNVYVFGFYGSYQNKIQSKIEEAIKKELKKNSFTL